MNRFNARLLVVGAFMLLSRVAVADVAVVVSPGFAGTPDQAQVAQVFLGKDKSLTPYMQQGPLAEEFIDKVLSRNASQYKAYWAKLAFTGGGRPPKELGSDAEVLSTVSGASDAIGFVDAGAVNDSVKVLFTL
ncbi:phosphate ABC transporter substrate-binding protein [Alteromonas gilva]|uniref:Phosphate ABC transporter substrate-binding protein n=1 Tax=Alteromonas gilva TaxID=2987522 RepID=A0ABT5KYB2_9ALTE|nr:phosphate ABC transporter substrate-binding protein [Alteromonas gilva]MDC8829191.1 phosphate ABC transporter substrate-binding protein [Alteromonas gilva]